MRKVQFAYSGGVVVYPDTPSLFKATKVIPGFITANYFGTMTPAQIPNQTPEDSITISGTTGLTQVGDIYVGDQGATITVSGEVTGLSNGSYLLPLERLDTGETIYANATITGNDNLNVSMIFPSSGDWETTSKLIKKKGLSGKQFADFEMKFKIGLA